MLRQGAITFIAWGSLKPYPSCSLGDTPGSVTPFFEDLSGESSDFSCMGKAKLESRELENEDVTTSTI